MSQSQQVPDRPFDLIYRVRNPDFSPGSWKTEFERELCLNTSRSSPPKMETNIVLEISTPLFSTAEDRDPASRPLALVTLCDSMEMDREIDFPESECPWLGPVLGFAGVHFLTVEGNPMDSEDLEQIAFSLAELSLGNFLLFPRNGAGAIDFEAVELRKYSLDLGRHSFDFGDELLSRKLIPGGYLADVIDTFKQKLLDLELELHIFFIEQASKCPIRYNFREGDYEVKYRGMKISADDPDMPVDRIHQILNRNSVEIWVKADLESELSVIHWMIEGYKYP